MYSGPGCVTKDGGRGSENWDFTYQPLDWADAIAKKHDMDYDDAIKHGGKYLGFLEDTRTLQADKDMINRVSLLLSQSSVPANLIIPGVEMPYKTSMSGEIVAAASGQMLVISAIARYKQWKIINNYTDKNDTFDKVGKAFGSYDMNTYLIIKGLKLDVKK